MDDYPTSIRAYSAAARLAMHRGQLEQANRELTRAMRARPFVTSAIPFLAVGARLELARVHLSMADLTSARHLAPRGRRPPARDGRASASSSTRRPRSTRPSRRRRITAARAPHRSARPSSALLPYLQTHLTFREIAERLYVSRNTVSSQVTSIYRKLGVSSRTEAVDQATAIGLDRSLVGTIGLLERRLGVVAERHAHLRRGRDDAGHADHGQDADQDGDDLGGGCPAAHRRIGRFPVGRAGAAADGDQRGESDEGERLGIEVVAGPQGLDLRSLPAPLMARSRNTSV